MSFCKNIIWSPANYAEASVVAREAGGEMLSRLTFVTLKPEVILDAGCGTGEMSTRLRELYPAAQIIAIDQSQAMIDYAKEQNKMAPHAAFICAQAESLPLPPQSVDLLFANLMLPWHVNLTAILREWRRVLRPDGLLTLTALGPDTLQEWRSVLAADECPYVIDMHDLGDVLLREGFGDPVLDVNHFTLTYNDKNRLNQELRASGMITTEVDLCKRQDVSPEESWSVTCEVIYAHAFAPAASDTFSASEDGLTHVPLSHLRRQLKGK